MKKYIYIYIDHDPDKYLTTPEFNKLAAENFAARLAKQILASKSDVANSIKKTNFHDKLKKLNKKATSSKAKDVLVENKFKKTTNISLKCFYFVKGTLIMMEHDFT